MRKLILTITGILFVVINANCDTVPGRFENQKPVFQTDASEIKPDEDHGSLFETPGYNQALVGLGFAGIFVVVGGFVYLLNKKKH